MSAVGADRALLDYAVEALRNLVPRGWSVDDEPVPYTGGLTPDALISLTDAAGERMHLFVEAKQHVSPSALARWSNVAVRERSPWLVVAPRLSLRSKDVLRSFDVNWLDAEGNVSLRLPRILLEVGSPDAKREARRLSTAGQTFLAPVGSEPPGRRYVADIFSGDALRIVRWLLIEPNKEWRVTEAAEKGGVSKGWASIVFATLERDAYIAGPPRGARRVVDPEGLLEAWAEAPAPHVRPIRTVTTESPGTVRERISALPEGSYALTGDAAADLVAPFARVAQVELYVDSGAVPVPDVLESLAARETTRGANLLVIPADDRGVMDGAETRDTQYGEIQVVSRPQLYVDLRRRGGASQEAAELLKERGNLWVR